MSSEILGSIVFVLYSLKTTENQIYFCCFQGLKMGALPRKGLMISEDLVPKHYLLRFFCFFEAGGKSYFIKQIFPAKMFCETLK